MRYGIISIEDSAADDEQMDIGKTLPKGCKPEVEE